MIQLILAVIAIRGLVWLYLKSRKNSAIDNYVSQTNEDEAPLTSSNFFKPLEEAKAIMRELENPQAEKPKETTTAHHRTTPSERITVEGINRNNEITSEQEEWYDNYSETFCGVGSTRVKFKLTAAAKKNTPFAMAYRLALEIGDQHSRMIEARNYALGHKDEDYVWCDYNSAKDKKDRAINKMVQLCIKEGYKFGVSNELENTLSILYVEFDGFAFATYWKIYDNERNLIQELPSDMQHVTVEDILPRLEKKLIEKFYNKTKTTKTENIKNKAISCPSEAFSPSVG